MRWLPAVVLLVSCHGSTTEPPAACDPARAAPDGRCLSAACEGDTVLLDGACVAVGVTRCAEGFSRVAEGCAPVMPESCAPSTVAFPGDAACHPLDTCAAGRFAGTGTDAIYVDATATAGDGTEAKPLPTLAAALAAARIGGQKRIEIAAGRYVERIVVDRELTLRGVCSAKVELVAPAGDLAATTVRVVASATITGVSIRGAGHATGVGTQGPASLTLSGVWVRGHETGIDAPRVASPAVPSLTMTDVRIEDGRFGVSSLIAVTGKRVSVGAVEEGLLLGGGGSLEQLVIDDAGSDGLAVIGGRLAVSRSVVRNVGKRAVAAGYGLVVDVPIGDAPSALVLEDSVVSDVSTVGIGANGGSLVVARCTVRDLGQNGTNLTAGILSAAGTKVRVEDTSVVRSQMAGLVLRPGDVELHRLLVRDTLEGPAGLGGVLVTRSDRAEHTLLEAILIDGAVLSGLYVAGQSVTARGVRVQRIRADRTGRFGDGVSVGSLEGGGAGVLALEWVTVTDIARAGVSVFGGELSLRDSLLCAAFPLETSDRLYEEAGKVSLGTSKVVDLGRNVCGCGAPLLGCVASQSHLAPLGVPP